MPKMHVSKSITIDAPTHRVFSIINNFHHWSIWSPWLVAEPESQLHVREDGKFYAWEGKRVGAGEMTIIDENPETTVDYDLTFLKPWKSTAKVRFLIEPVSQKTKVTWLMDSRLPFFLFWMKKSMEAFVGMDFTRGLNMLKEYIETGKVSSELNFIGQSLYPGSKYFGITTESTISRVGADMQEDFKKIGAFLQDKGIKPAHQLFSMYRKWDMVKDKVIYTAGVPVNEIPADLPSSFISGEIP
ncbi:MAG: SRPBCC family protein, partial [Saprospiraceae bacterium]|nr:SRPBCC family protein [Saprospiraceae bacterium]